MKEKQNKETEKTKGDNWFIGYTAAADTPQDMLQKGPRNPTAATAAAAAASAAAAAASAAAAEGSAAAAQELEYETFDFVESCFVFNKRIKGATAAAAAAAATAKDCQQLCLEALGCTHFAYIVSPSLSPSISLCETFTPPTNNNNKEASHPSLYYQPQALAATAACRIPGELQVYAHPKAYIDEATAKARAAASNAAAKNAAVAAAAAATAAQAPLGAPQGAPQEALEGAPQGAPPEGTSPQGAPNQGAPPQEASPQGAPNQGAPNQGSPPQGAPFEGAPPQGAPFEGASPRVNRGVGEEVCSDLYNLEESFIGDDFWDLSKFFFFEWGDPTGGTVEYVGKQTAQRYSLIKTLSDKRIHIKADTTETLASNKGRKAIRLTSQRAWTDVRTLFFASLLLCLFVYLFVLFGLFVCLFVLFVLFASFALFVCLFVCFVWFRLFVLFVCFVCLFCLSFVCFVCLFVLYFLYISSSLYFVSPLFILFDASIHQKPTSMPVCLHACI